MFLLSLLLIVLKFAQPMITGVFFGGGSEEMIRYRVGSDIFPPVLKSVFCWSAGQGKMAGYWFSGSVVSPRSCVALNEGMSCFLKYLFCGQTRYKITVINEFANDFGRGSEN